MNHCALNNNDESAFQAHLCVAVLYFATISFEQRIEPLGVLDITRFHLGVIGQAPFTWRLMLE